MSNQALVERLSIYLPRGGDYQRPDVRRDLSLPYHRCGEPKVLEPAVGARADNDLIDGHLPYFAYGPRVRREKRECHQRLELRGVVFPDVEIFGVRVAGVERVLTLGTVFDISFGDFVRSDDAALAARFNRHVAYREPVGHAEALDRLTGEFHRPVKRAVNPDIFDDPEDDVLAGNPFAELAVEDELHRCRNTEPGLAGNHRGGEVRAADARREGAETAVCASMAVCADHQVSGNDHPFFRQERVFHTHFTLVPVVGYLVLDREILEHLRLLGAFDVLVGSEVVRNKHDLISVKHLACARFLELPDRDRGGNIVAKRDIYIGHDEFARAD